MSVKGITEIPGNGPNNDKKGEFKKLLGDIVASIHDRAESYFWKLIGDSPECISTLIGCEPHIMIHILGKCDLYDEDSNKFTKDIKDNVRCFPPCEITWNRQKGESMEYYLHIGTLTTRESLNNASKQYQKGKLSVLPNSRKKDNEAVHKPRFTEAEQRMIKELISLANSSFCSKPNAAPVTRNGSKRSKKVVKVKSPAKHQKPPCTKPMTVDKQIVRDMMKELEKSLTSYVLEHGNGLKDPAAILSKYLLNQNIYPHVVTSSLELSPGTPAMLESHGTSIATTPSFDARIEVTPTALEVTPTALEVTPTGISNKRPALSSLGIDVENGNRSTLLAATRELLEFLMDGNQSLAMEAWNGRRLVVVYPKQSQTSKAFVSNAKKSGWVDALLGTSTEQREGMIEFLSAKNKTEMGMDTYQVDALGTILQLSGNQVKHVRAYAKLELGVKSAHNDKILKGMEEGPEPVFKNWTYAIGGKVVEDNIRSWTTDAGEEACSMVKHDYLETLNDSRQKGETLFRYPSLDYVSPANPKGVTMLTGGDHGDGCFRFHMKLHLSSPMVRKEKKNISYRCPRRQCGFIDCKQDKYPVLKNTIMKRIDEGRKHLVQSRMVVAYDKTDLEQLQCFLIPKTTEAMEVKICEDGIGRQVVCTLEAGGTHTCELEERFHTVSIQNVALTMAISQFNNFHIGDIKYFCYLIGMVNSDTCHCMYCRQVQSKWGTGKLDAETPRTAANLEADWKEFKRIVAEAKLKGLKKKINNHKGANNCFLLDIEPDQILPPSLHCEIGIINKFVNDSNKYIHAHVESLSSAEDRYTRSEYLSATSMLREALVYNLQLTRELTMAKADRRRQQEHFKTLPKVPWAEDYIKQAKEVADSHVHDLDETFSEFATSLKDLRQRKNTATSNYTDMQTARKRVVGGYWHKLEKIYRKLGMEREAYHGGDFNGVDCRRLMANAIRFYELWLELVLETHDPTQTTVTVDELRQRMQQYRDLLGKLDVIFSMVRGVDFLLPTPEEIQTLETVIEAARVLWLQCGFNIEGNPKAHLFFDGHLLEQFIKHGGLADKTEDPIEFDHQEWKKEKDRTRSVKNFKLQQKCQIKRMRRKSHWRVRRIISNFNNSRKRQFKEDRQQQDADKLAAKVAVKEERRTTFIQA
jgi:hypothetical protein